MPRKILPFALCVAVLLSMGQIRVRLKPSGGATPGLITTSNLSCEGKFRIATPQRAGGLGANGAGSGNHTTMRIDSGDGKRHYFTLVADADVWESVEPTLSTCSTANNSTNISTAASWGTGPTGDGTYGSDWGYLPYTSAANCDGLPSEINQGLGQCTSQYAALRWDPTSSMMMSFWVEAYAGNGHVGKPSFGASPMNFTTHTFGSYGCWNSNAGLNDQEQGTGAMFPPSSWVAANSANLPSGNVPYWIIGVGGPAGNVPQSSYGPSLTIAAIPSSGNSCTSGVSYPIGTSTILSLYSVNSNGPICTTYGCTPSQAPTHPYQMKTSFQGYVGTPTFPDWVPYGGTGYFTSSAMFSMDWYDDGTLHGIIVPFINQSGYRSDTVQSSPSPTYNTSTHVGTFSVTSLATLGDSQQINPYDNIWVTTCSNPPDGSGCDPANNNNQSGGYVQSVSGTGPYTITYFSNAGLDAGNGTSGHVPVIGAEWHVGATYGHGDTAFTLNRSVARMQILDPNEYVKVLNGTYATTDLPTYAEDIDATSLFPGLGSPASGSGINAGNGGNVFRWPFTTIADNANKRVIVVFNNESATSTGVQSCPNFYYCATAYVLKVQ